MFTCVKILIVNIIHILLNILLGKRCVKTKKCIQIDSVFFFSLLHEKIVSMHVSVGNVGQMCVSHTKF